MMTKGEGGQKTLKNNTVFYERPLYEMESRLGS